MLSMTQVRPFRETSVHGAFVVHTSCARHGHTHLLHLPRIGVRQHHRVESVLVGLEAGPLHLIEHRLGLSQQRVPCLPKEHQDIRKKHHTPNALTCTIVARNTHATATGDV